MERHRGRREPATPPPLARRHRPLLPRAHRLPWNDGSGWGRPRKEGFRIPPTMLKKKMMPRSTGKNDVSPSGMAVVSSSAPMEEE